MSTYDVVIATRNRASTLRRCIELIEQQTVLPIRVIVVDASDDQNDARSIVEQGRSTTIKWHYLKARANNLPAQRNQGLSLVESGIVLLPDDDSLLYPESAAEILRVYELDTGRRIAGVSGVAASSSPSDTANQRETTRALKDKLTPIRRRIEARFIKPPFDSYPEALWCERDIPTWIDGTQFALVENIGGFLLSLRADLAKVHRFDEILGYGIGYALHEDMELSMRLQSLGYLLVGAHRAPIFHDVYPGKRAGGYAYGFCWLSNYLYACCKNIPASHPARRRHLKRFLKYKLTLYATRSVISPTTYNRDVLRGALDAWGARDVLLKAADLEAAYRNLCDSEMRIRDHRIAVSADHSPRGSGTANLPGR